MLDTLETYARRAAGRLPASTRHWAVRRVHERSERLSVRDDVTEAPSRAIDDGVMVTVVDGGMGYAATGDVSEAGLAAAFERAHVLARASAGRTMVDYERIARPTASGRCASAVARTTEAATLPEKPGWLQEVCAASGSASGSGRDPRIVDRRATLWSVQTEQLYLTSDGARTQQQWEFTTPSVEVSAHASGVTQVRSSGGQYNRFCQQGGIEVLERAGFRSTEVPRVAREVLELVCAAPCPSGTLDVILMPDQMTLQIHESIGHPLELDRILGDERSRHWHRVESFHFDWCVYHRADKAVKTAYAGTHWDDAAFVARLGEAATHVKLLENRARMLQPGDYRAAFAPAAMAELLGTLGWSGFSLKARRTGVSSLMRLQRGEASFARGFHLEEAFARSTTAAASPTPTLAQH